MKYDTESFQDDFGKDLPAMDQNVVDESSVRKSDHYGSKCDVTNSVSCQEVVNMDKVEEENKKEKCQ